MAETKNIRRLVLPVHGMESTSNSKLRVKHSSNYKSLPSRVFMGKCNSAAASLLTVVMVTAYSLASVPEKRQTSCAPIHLFVARVRTGEYPGDGSIGSLAQLVINESSGTTQEAINYPGGSFPIYIDDVWTGITADTNEFTEYASCSNTTLMLIGYSQGAQIILDALCSSGNAANGSTGSPTITTSQGKNIAAVVGHGDPGHVAGESWDEGTATTNGLSIYARPAGACNACASVIHSYCNTGDPFCASGNNIMIHMEYPHTYNTQASQWINQQLALMRRKP
ncbi:cutinase-domain-containing protein [Talaromyces proteolyticus]|uniref:Cutinase-domain-containing protein n=1 Tax=Talaromyces proteolyticus TaxID=1131652 RepID=A0AAD4KVS1_9EURO|nr:cutinase-domain-containing protein [Talaromyces proteolyticus]KAH8700914.1 cutinase-domain-containing protein [Talaromyces proteolyticus]